MFIVSTVTFSIFFLVPRLTGGVLSDLARPVRGQDRGRGGGHEVADRLGFDAPLAVQYGRFVKGIVVGRDYNFGPATKHCPPPCFGYSFVEPDRRCGRTCSTGCRSPSRSPSAPPCIWLLFGVATGVVSALRRGTSFDRRHDIALAGVSLPIYFTGLLPLAIFVHNLARPPPGGNYVAFTDEPARLGVRI